MLEHPCDPVAVVHRGARWLKNDGVLAVTTNNVASPLARLRREKWRQIHPPTYLFYFSAETLAQAHPAGRTGAPDRSPAP